MDRLSLLRMQQIRRSHLLADVLEELVLGGGLAQVHGTHLHLRLEPVHAPRPVYQIPLWSMSGCLDPQLRVCAVRLFRNNEGLQVVLAAKACAAPFLFPTLPLHLYASVCMLKSNFHQVHKQMHTPHTDVGIST